MTKVLIFGEEKTLRFLTRFGCVTDKCSLCLVQELDIFTE